MRETDDRSEILYFKIIHISIKNERVIYIIHLYISGSFGNKIYVEMWNKSNSGKQWMVDYLLPDRPAAARQSQTRPLPRDRVDHLLVHPDLPPPVPLGLGWQLGRGVEADLAAEAGLRAGEIEIVDRRVLDHRDVAG